MTGAAPAVESAEARISRYLHRAEQLAEEAYLEVSETRRNHLGTLASLYDDLARTTGEYLRI